MGKAIIFLFLFFLFVSLALAINYEYIYNPYTGKLDRTVTLNQSGYNFTIDCLRINNSIICDWSKVSEVITDVWINETGDIWQGNMNASGYDLTDLGRLIADYIELHGNLTFDEDSLYNIGSPEIWLDNIWVNKIWSKTMNATNITTLQLDANSIQSLNVTTSGLTTINLTANDGDVNNLTSKTVNIGNFVLKNDSQDFIIDLGG